MDPKDYEEMIQTFPNKTKIMRLELAPSLAFDIIYYTINTPRSYCIKLEEAIETGNLGDVYHAETVISLTTSSAEPLLAKIEGNHQKEISINAYSYDEQIIDKFLVLTEKRVTETLEDLKACDVMQIEDLRSGITILKELDRVYYYSLSGEKYQRIYFMLADSRERLYKIMNKGRYGSFNSALIEMQSYLGMILRQNQDSPIKEPDSLKVGLAALKWKNWILILIQKIFKPEEAL
jgi:hypothetical protein